MLVRNPYKRLESFYKDKLRQHPLRRLYTDDKLLDCQRIFCPYIQINDHESPTEIRDKLLSVSFPQFIKLLPQVYHLDGHLRPQTKLTLMYFRRVPIGYMKFDKILKILSLEDIAYLQNDLSIDLSRKYNDTNKIQLSKPWSPALRHIVNNLYQADFEAFNYEMLTG